MPQPEPFKVRPPKGAPNILLILLDQTAYADPSTFGGPISFPTLDRLASESERTRSAEVRRALRQYVARFHDRDEQTSPAQGERWGGADADGMPRRREGHR